RLQAGDIGLRRARGVHKGRVAGVEVREVRDLVGPEGTADAGMLWPAVHAGLEEGTVYDQLAPSVEQVEQARWALGPVESILLFLNKQLLARSFPLLRGYDRRRVHVNVHFGLLSFVRHRSATVWQPFRVS